MNKSAAQRTKKEVMVDILRDAILSGELQPGERLLQEELAERFNVSPTPVREAIQQLVAEGVLRHSPYRGVQVAEVQFEDVQEVYLVRSVLEGLATRLAVPNLRIGTVQRLHKLQADIETHTDAPQQSPLIKLNNEFHRLIYDAAEMPLLNQIIKTLWLKTPWDALFVLPQRAPFMVEEHRRILDAIDQRDAVLAGQRMQEHIEQSAAALADYLSAS